MRVKRLEFKFGLGLVNHYNFGVRGLGSNFSRSSLFSIKRDTGVKRNSRVKRAQAWAMLGWVTS